MNDELNLGQDESIRKRGRPTAGMTAKAADNLRTNVEERIKFRRDTSAGRNLGPDDADLNLYVPEGTIPAGYTGLWVLDDGKGALDKKLSEWWGHVTDAQGNNIKRQSGGKMVYLMAIEDEYKKEMDDLQLKRYYDSIGENDRAGLGVNGLETYGEGGKIRVTSNPFD
jgi:hypothetical protein